MPSAKPLGIDRNTEADTICVNTEADSEAEYTNTDADAEACLGSCWRSLCAHSSPIPQPYHLPWAANAVMVRSCMHTLPQGPALEPISKSCGGGQGPAKEPGEEQFRTWAGTEDEAQDKKC